MGFAKVLEDEIDSFLSGFNCTSEMQLNVFLSSKRSNWMTSELETRRMTSELETRRMTSAAHLIMHKSRGQCQYEQCNVQRGKCSQNSFIEHI